MFENMPSVRRRIGGTVFRVKDERMHALVFKGSFPFLVWRVETSDWGDGNFHTRVNVKAEVLKLHG